MEDTILRVSELTKDYRDVQAVDTVSFTVRAGEIVGLLGPNGAGKTTTISMILGVLEPRSGDIYVLEKNFKKEREKILEDVNFGAVYARMPGNETVYQNLYIFALLYNVKNPRERVEELLKKFSLERFRDTKAGVLSSGEQTRVTLAKALINKPRLLLLDEPTASLDPNSAYFIRNEIRSYANKEGAGILWTSHNMHEVEAVCDRVLFLSRGKIILEGDPKTLPQRHGKKDLEELFITVAREPLSLEGITE